jgi:hypothetical protein
MTKKKRETIPQKENNREKTISKKNEAGMKKSKCQDGLPNDPQAI